MAFWQSYAKINHKFILGCQYALSFWIVGACQCGSVGYFLLVPSTDKNVEQAKTSLVAPVSFTDTTNQLPPEIGKK